MPLLLRSLLLQQSHDQIGQHKECTVQAVPAAAAAAAESCQLCFWNPEMCCQAVC